MSALRRFVIRPESIAGNRVTLKGSDAHHIAVVLRLQRGDHILAVDGTVVERVVELEAVGGQEVRGRVVRTQVGARLPLWLAVLQGVPKGGKMDTVIRMGTELGVAQFVPVRFHRSVAEATHRTSRWRRIASEAAKQSQRTDVPIVSEVVSAAEGLALVAGYDRVLLLWEGERTRTLADGLVDVPIPARVAVIVGPEGGLEPIEVEEAVRASAVPVTLGPLVLRTESAAVVAVSMVRYELTLRRTSTLDPGALPPGA